MGERGGCMPKTVVYCTVCGEKGIDLGGGWWIKLCHKHRLQEAKDTPKNDNEDDIYKDYDFPCGY